MKNAKTLSAISDPMFEWMATAIDLAATQVNVNPTSLIKAMATRGTDTPKTRNTTPAFFAYYIV
jgi:hypothetical protein